MKLKKICIFLLLIFLMSETLVFAGSGGRGKPPKKTVIEINDLSKAERVIIDGKGQVIYKKGILEPGNPIEKLFIQDDQILGGKSTIQQFLRDKGARVRGTRESNYYPIDIDRILENQNLFSNSFWKSDFNGAKELLDLEKDHLKLSISQYALNEKDKNFQFEPSRVCIQGGKMLSNFEYYRNEIGGCYHKSSGRCEATFNTFPLFKTCSSLTSLKDSFKVPWEDNYVISCNFNSNFATLPSFIKNVNFGYSYCVVKNLETNEDENTIIIGNYLGNPQLENIVSDLKVSPELLFESSIIHSVNELTSTTKTVKSIEQKSINLGKKILNSPYTEDLLELTLSGIQENYSRLAPPLIGTSHVGSQENKVSSNYLLVEDIREKEEIFKKYKVTLNDLKEYYVYLNEYTSWYAISNYDIDLEDIFNEYSKVPELPTRTGERILIQKVEDSKKYSIIEMSERLYYKHYGNSSIFNPNDNAYTNYPIYYLKIENVSSDSCKNLFDIYNFEESNSLTYGEEISCIVEGNILHSYISEREFSNTFSPNFEIGAGYILLRNILFP